MFNVCLMYERNICILSNVCFLPGPDSQATHQFLYQLTIGKYNQYCNRLHYALIKLILPQQTDLVDTSLIFCCFRTRTPSGSGPRGTLQRSGSNLKTPYSADGNKFGSSSALRNAVGSTRDWQQ